MGGRRPRTAPARADDAGSEGVDQFAYLEGAVFERPVPGRRRHVLPLSLAMRHGVTCGGTSLEVGRGATQRGAIRHAWATTNDAFRAVTERALARRAAAERGEAADAVVRPQPPPAAAKPPPERPQRWQRVVGPREQLYWVKPVVVATPRVQVRYHLPRQHGSSWRRRPPPSPVSECAPRRPRSASSLVKRKLCEMVDVYG